MIFRGYYRRTTSGRLAPFIRGYIPSTIGEEIPITFLLDTGADATYLPKEYLDLLKVKAERFHYDVAGVGSRGLEYVKYSTRLRLVTDGQEKSIPVVIGIFTAPGLLDFPVLGADVLDQFILILDCSRQLVALLDRDESYSSGQ